MSSSLISLPELFEVSKRISIIDARKVYRFEALRLADARDRGLVHDKAQCTSAAIAGASERSMMKQTGHRSVQMVRRYIRDGSLFRENSAGKLGL